MDFIHNFHHHFRMAVSRYFCRREFHVKLPQGRMNGWERWQRSVSKGPGARACFFATEKKPWKRRGSWDWKLIVFLAPAGDSDCMIGKWCSISHICTYMYSCTYLSVCIYIYDFIHLSSIWLYDICIFWLLWLLWFIIIYLHSYDIEIYHYTQISYISYSMMWMFTLLVISSGIQKSMETHFLGTRKAICIVLLAGFWAPFRGALNGLTKADWLTLGEH